jgi:putative transcription antitermination factor YqgF
MSNYLGIDYGLKHIGLAVAEATLATPLMSINNDNTVISRLASIISREGITHVVCGIPEGKLAPIITQFAAKLEQACGIPVILHPETLSTQEAISLLHASGAKRAKIQNDHVYAACLILEDYLEFATS